jgi:hypothetical protein
VHAWREGHRGGTAHDERLETPVTISKQDDRGGRPDQDRHLFGELDDDLDLDG